MLEVFRGKCKFKMYIPKKLHNYGLKIMYITDSQIRYLLDAYLYSRKDSDGKGLPAEYQRLKKPTQVVL